MLFKIELNITTWNVKLFWDRTGAIVIQIANAMFIGWKVWSRYGIHSGQKKHEPGFAWGPISLTIRYMLR